MNDRNCNSDSTYTPYSIEKQVSDRPLESYAVGRIFQLEAQVENQKNRIDQLKETLDKLIDNHQELIETLKPNIGFSFRSIRSRVIEIAGATIAYCKYERDKYYRLIYLLGLQKENYEACMQEYESEINDGTETDLSDDERIAAKADYEAKLKKEGVDNNAN